MRLENYVWAYVGLLLVGCEATRVETPAPPANPPAAGAADSAAASAPESAGGEAPPAPAPPSGNATASGTPAPLVDGKAALSPANTSIQFVGNHEGDDPKPRVGGFTKFSGSLTVDPATKQLQAVTVEIDTDSLWTEFDKLTTHLKSPDFLETRQFPAIKFVSKSVAAAGSETQIVGDLELHGVTTEIQFPATASVSDAGVTLESKFTVDRSQFNMTYGAGQVENLVELTVVVGQPTQPRTSAP